MRKKILFVSLTWVVLAVVVFVLYLLRDSPVKEFIAWALSVWPILATFGGIAILISTWVIKHDFANKTLPLKLMKLKVRMNDKGKVEAIERDDKTPNWITKYQQANQQKLPPLPKWLYPVLNIRDEKGYRTLTNDTGSYSISKALEVTPFSGQWWNSLRDDRKAEVLELVEWLGGDANEYVNSSEIMYPKSQDFSKRK